MKKIIFTINILTLAVIMIVSCAKQKDSLQEIQTVSQEKWVDSIYNDMPLKERIGQLFMVDAYSNKGKTHTDSIKQLIKEHHLGGLCFFQGGPVRQALLTNEYQSISRIPLMIGIDAEWGLNMRLDSTFRYPNNMTLGAIQDNNILIKIGKQIGKHCKRIGIHINFAPVLDINTNPKNPIIGVRSYGEGKINVANKAAAFTEGIQSENVLACAKHFPGHGDTDKDSHKTLPTVSFDIKRIDSVELYPFKKLFSKGIASVMVAHLNIPSIQVTKGLPTSLSSYIVTDLLKEKLGFKGLIFTDALNMKGAANYKKPGYIDLVAFEAGNDVLLFSENAPKGMSLIEEAYINGRITEDRLSHSVKKILRSKYDVNLHKYKPIKIADIKKDINTTEDKALYHEAVSSAITLIKDSGSILSTINKNKKIAYIKIGSGSNKSFLTTLQKHIKVDDLTGLSLKSKFKKLKAYDLVIISYHRFNTRRIKQLKDEDLFLIQEIAKNNKVILDVFANQYSLVNLSFKDIESVIISYENTKMIQSVSAKIILGIQNAKGKLPASINSDYSVNYHGVYNDSKEITKQK